MLLTAYHICTKLFVQLFLRLLVYSLIYVELETKCLCFDDFTYRKSTANIIGRIKTKLSLTFTTFQRDLLSCLICYPILLKFSLRRKICRLVPFKKKERNFHLEIFTSTYVGRNLFHYCAVFSNCIENI